MSPREDIAGSFLKRIAIAARLFGKELHCLKLKRLDLRRADLRLGAKAYATGTAYAQAELVSRLNGVTEHITQLQRQEIEAATTFAGKAKAFASKIGKAVQIGALQRKRRRILRRLGANLRQSAANGSLVEETQLARGVADRVSSVETEISQLAPQTYPWARRPLLLVCLLLLLAAIGGALVLRHKPTPALTQQRKVAGGSSLSDAQFKKLESQAQAFREQLLRQQAEMSRQETEATQARITAAERQYREKRERERAEVEKRQRDEAAERDRIAAERARQEEKQREEERRIAAEKAKQEQQQREAGAQREKERQEAAAREEQKRKEEAAQYAKNEAARNQLVAQNSPSQPGAQPRPANSSAIESIEGLRRAAEAGDAEAMLRLGNRYRTGEGVQKDFTEAARWYRKAADAGQKDAMMYLGGYAEGVEKDLSEAARWYRKAAEAGRADAMVSLGILYADGKGVAKDPAEAVRWYHKAADLGESRGMFNLALHYGKGEGVQQNNAEAANWYRKAAEVGNSGAMYNLAICYHEGEGVQKDKAEAVRWFRKAAELDLPNAMYSLALCYDEGEGVQKDKAEAMQWYRKAAKAGDVDAMIRIFTRYEKVLDDLVSGISTPLGSDLKENAMEAGKLLAKAAANGDKQARAFLTQADQRADERISKGRATEARASQDLKKLWDNMLVLSDGRHVAVGENGEFYVLKSMTDFEGVKLTGAAKEEAERLLKERQSRPGNIATRTAVATQRTPSSSGGSAWASSYRNAKFITAAELLRQVGPVHLTIIASTGARRCVADPENLVKTSATAHGWKLVPEATDFELVVNADIREGRITTTHSPGYIQIYTIWMDVTLRTKANCRRGDEFVRLTVFPYNESYHVSGAMSDPLHFTRNYKESFRLAMDNLFDAMGNRTDAADKDDEAAWTASLWPPGEDAEMEKKFLAPLQGETGGSQRVFYGISKVGLSWVHLLEEADKYINARAIEQAWENELKTNGQIIDPSSIIGISHDIGTFWQGEPGFYVNASHSVVWQRGVVFNLNGELRRRTVCIWGGGSIDMALPKQQTGPGEIANLTIRITAKELASAR